MRSCLVDVNVWLALIDDTTDAHRAAITWYGRLKRDQALMCRQTQLSMLRLLTNSRVMLDRTRSLIEAWSILDEVQQDERVSFSQEPSGLETALRAYTHRPRAGSNLVSDAYLAAFARAADVDLVSFDAGFRQFRGLSSLILKA